MPFNGSGTFTLVSGNPVVTGSTISSTWANNSFTDFATGFTTCLTKDGQTTPTVNLPMGNFKHTGAGSATASGQYLVYGQNSAVLGSLNCTGTQTMTGAVANIAAEVDVASATATDIGGAASNQIRITGTTQIDGFGTTYTGPRFLRFAGILQLTNSSTLVLPGGANITTAAGDTCIALPLPSSGGWYVSTYTPASGAPVLNNAILKSVLTTAGDMIYAAGASTPARLGIGTAGQIQRVNAGATAPSWSAPTIQSAVITTTGAASVDSGEIIPAWATEVIITYSAVSTNGTSNLMVQIGDAGGIETASYASTCFGNATASTSTAGFLIANSVSAATNFTGVLRLNLHNAAAFTWIASGTGQRDDLANPFTTSGIKSTSAAMTQIRLTTVGGSDTFDAMSMTVSYR